MYYPRRILLPTVEKSSSSTTSKIQPNLDIRELFVRSRIARCRSRFVVPVILFDGKVRIFSALILKVTFDLFLQYICRSSTVASWGEVYSRSGVDRFLDTPTRTSTAFVADTPMNSSTATTDLDGPPNSAIAGAAAAAASNNEAPQQQQNIFDKLRGADIDLLKILDVSSIVNLMVEKRKTMFGVK